MARCLRARPAETDASKKADTYCTAICGKTRRRRAAACHFRSGGLPASSTVRSCLRDAGAAAWTADGLQDINGSQSACGRRWHGTKDARCLLKNKDLAFIGNSVIRRQMYSVLDLLAGKSAHRLLPNGTSVDLGGPRNTSIDILNTRVWDQEPCKRLSCGAALHNRPNPEPIAFTCHTQSYAASALLIQTSTREEHGNGGRARYPHIRLALY